MRCEFQRRLSNWFSSVQLNGSQPPKGLMEHCNVHALAPSPTGVLWPLLYHLWRILHHPFPRRGMGMRRMGNVLGVSTMMSSMIRLVMLLSGGREDRLDTS